MAARAAAEARRAATTRITHLALEWQIAAHPRAPARDARRRRYSRCSSRCSPGHSQTEIAEQLGVSRREVELTLRYIEELLQRAVSPRSRHVNGL